MPRWGFPALSWRWPLVLSAPYRPNVVRRVEELAAVVGMTLWTTAVLAGLAAFAEGWRYVLLLRSRTEVLGRVSVAISDALVVTAGALTWIGGVVCGVLVVLWFLRARSVAADRAGVRPARPDWQVVLGVVVPGLNLSLPGSALAELEHTVLVAEGARQLGNRPRPSRLFVIWWLLWDTSLVLGWLAYGWGFFRSVQALADGVVLHAWNDIAVVLVAVTTGQVVAYITRLLTPVDTTESRRHSLVRTDAPRSVTRADRHPDAPR
jgi:hypothetical protein